jgi:hypothetical protein
MVIGDNKREVLCCVCVLSHPLKKVCVLRVRCVFVCVFCVQLIIYRKPTFVKIFISFILYKRKEKDKFKMLSRLSIIKSCRWPSQLFKSFVSMRQVVLKEPGPSNSLKLETSNIELPSILTMHNTIRVRVAACAVAYRDIIDRTGDCNELLNDYYYT